MLLDPRVSQYGHHTLYSCLIRRDRGTLQATSRSGPMTHLNEARTLIPTLYLEIAIAESMVT